MSGGMARRVGKSLSAVSKEAQSREQGFAESQVTALERRTSCDELGKGGLCPHCHLDLPLHSVPDLALRILACTFAAPCCRPFTVSTPACLRSWRAKRPTRLPKGTRTRTAPEPRTAPTSLGERQRRVKRSSWVDCGRGG